MSVAGHAPRLSPRWAKGRIAVKVAVATLITIAPTRALADICARIRPNWTPGTTPTLLSETLALAATPPSLLLFLATLACLRFRLQWPSLIVVLLWTVWVSAVAFLQPDAMRRQAIAEGCIGSPALFIGIVAALCVGLILYTAPRSARD